jgi:CTP:molybdopterin cytidylyltransferase MocA
MGVSFLTPLAGLFALTAVIPVAALLLMEGRARRLRQLFSLAAPRSRELVTAAVALALLPALVAVAATQPIVIHKRTLTERVDAQVFLVFDTSLSMSARGAPSAPTRLARAKQEAKALIPQLGDIPVGVATMTDRVLPSLMPTTNVGVALQTVDQSVRIDEPPPTLRYHGRASTLQALVPIAGDRLFPPGVKHPILVILTDGEEQAPPPFTGYSFAQQIPIPPLLVHIWAPTERIYTHGRVDPNYLPDPSSGHVLTNFARLTHGQVFRESDLKGLLRAIHAEAGSAPARVAVLGYARIPLGPWFILAGVVPLGFLFYRRNL